MTKFYFFQSVRENGFLKLRALPGQTTYYGYRDQDHPVDVTLNVQCSTEARHLQCRYGEGYIFVAKVEGPNARGTRLGLYVRNGVHFYRLDAMAYPVWYMTGNCPVSYRSDDDLPEVCMRDAFAAFRQDNRQTASSGAVDNTTLVRLARLNEDEINAMAAYVATDRPLKPTLLKLSRLRDLMAVGVAKFEYVKQNGDRRTAFGTRRPDIIERCPNADGNADRVQDGAHFNYYDMQRRDWRCFCVHDFVDVDLSFLAASDEDIASMIPAIN